MLKIDFKKAIIILLIGFSILILLETNAFANDITPEQDKDLQILYRIVESEATGEGYYGKVMVAETILNRVNSNLFPNDVESVVFQITDGIHQFSPIKDGRFLTVDVTKETVEAVHNVYFGGVKNKDMLFFEATYVENSWAERNRELYTVYKNHVFYR